MVHSTGNLSSKYNRIIYHCVVTCEMMQLECFRNTSCWRRNTRNQWNIGDESNSGGLAKITSE